MDGTYTNIRADIKPGVYWTYFTDQGGYMTQNKYDGASWSHRDEDVMFYRKFLHNCDFYAV